MNLPYTCRIAAFVFLLPLSSAIQINAQGDKTSSLREDTLRQRVLNAKDLKDKIFQSEGLVSFYLRNNNKVKADSLLKTHMLEAETTGNKEVMSLAYNYAGLFNYMDKRKEYMDKAYETAISAKLTNRAAQVLVFMCRFEIFSRNYDEAMNQLNRIDLNDEAISDSTRYIFYITKSAIYKEKEEMLNSFKMLFKAGKYAEKTGSGSLQRSVNENIAKAYFKIKDYDNALKYYLLEKESFQKDNLGFGLINMDLEIGKVYAEMKKYDDAEILLNNAILHADDIGDKNLKYTAVENLSFLFYERDAAKYIATEHKYQLSDYYLQMKDTANYYNFKGDFYYMKNDVDSAENYFLKSLAIMRQKGDQNYAAYQLKWLGGYYRRKGDNNKSLLMLKQSLPLFDSLHSVSGLSDVYKELDSTYAKLGDYKNGYEAKTNYLFYKDSIDKMSSKDDILKEELAAEEESMAKAEEAAKKATERKHDIQYRFIILGAILLLIGLLAIGFFHPPNWLVKGLAFVSFIFIFEFIILILDSKLHHWFHGAPLPILATKVLIACLLVPLHHITEKKVILFLQSKKLHRLKTVFKDEPVKSV